MLMDECRDAERRVDEETEVLVCPSTSLELSYVGSTALEGKSTPAGTLHSAHRKRRQTQLTVLTFEIFV